MIANLRKLRTEAGISQQQLANILLVSQQSIKKYENHNVEPDINTLIKMADYFNVSIDYLVGRTDISQTFDTLTKSDLSTEESQLIKDLRQLKPQQKNCIFTLMDSYK